MCSLKFLAVDVGILRPGRCGSVPHARSAFGLAAAVPSVDDLVFGSYLLLSIQVFRVPDCDGLERPEKNCLITEARGARLQERS